MTDLRKDRERILDAMREYADLGMPVIPVCAHDHAGYTERHMSQCRQAGKIPIIKGWREHQVTTREQIKSWIQEFRHMNVGLPLGAASGYVGIDIDGAAGFDMLEDLSKGDLPTTWEYSTGAGHRILYNIPVGMKTKKFVNPGEGEHEECSIICEGQQTVIPPSIHHSGHIYAWAEGLSPEDIDCALAPPWLLDLIRLEPLPQGVNIGGIRPSSDTPLMEVKPVVVSDNTLAAFFTDYQSLPLDLVAPDPTYTGNKVKAQEEDEKKLKQEELMSPITSGNRDNQMTRIIGSFCAQFRSLGKDYIMVMAKNHNLTFCQPPLEDFAVEAKVNHFWELESMKTNSYKEAAQAGSSNKGPTFAPSTIAQVAINLLEDQGYVLKADPEQSIIWMSKRSEGPWVPVNAGGQAFYGFIRDAMANPEHGGAPEWTTLRQYRDVANAVTIELRAQGREWITNSRNVDTQTLSHFKYIPLAGGKLLEWQTGELLPWNPETHLTYVLPIEYDPDATAPTWEMRLKEWLPDEGSRNIMQEFTGYSLIPYMGFEKALVIQGEGANGKSLFLETIQGLLGYKVVDSINMRNLFSRFGQADLVGKILNIVNEAGSEYLRGGNADDFKNLVSGGRVKADIKNMAPLTFNNTAKFIFASNHDIKTGDKSEGWLRRMLFVPFDQDFRNSTVPKFEIMEPLRQEYAGILNWAVEGLRRLMRQQQFSQSTASSAKQASYMKDNDISADFFMSCLETFELTSSSADGKITRSGTPSALVNALFGSWIEYRESSVQKKVDHITKYLEKKHRLVKARTTHSLLVKKVMTECWIGLRVNIRDTAFLDMLINEPIPKFPELKEYAIQRLSEIDSIAVDDFVPPTPPTKNNVAEFPNSQAN